jgi:hypothetical protein
MLEIETNHKKHTERNASWEGLLVSKLLLVQFV